MSERSLNRKKGTPVPKVVEIPGESMSFFVQSSTRLNLQHRVEIDAYGNNGACGCENFEIRCRGRLEKGAAPSNALRCRHIRAARDYFLTKIMGEISKQKAIERLKRIESERKPR